MQNRKIRSTHEIESRISISMEKNVCSNEKLILNWSECVRACVWVTQLVGLCGSKASFLKLSNPFMAIEFAFRLQTIFRFWLKSHSLLLSLSLSQNEEINVKVKIVQMGEKWPKNKRQTKKTFITNLSKTFNLLPDSWINWSFGPSLQGREKQHSIVYFDSFFNFFSFLFSGKMMNNITISSNSIEPQIDRLTHLPFLRHFAWTRNSFRLKILVFYWIFFCSMESLPWSLFYYCCYCSVFSSNIEFVCLFNFFRAVVVVCGAWILSIIRRFLLVLDENIVAEPV